MNHRKKGVIILSAAAMILLLTASLVSILSDDGGKPYLFTSLRGEQVEIYGGHGVYKNDSVIKAILFRGFDWANIAVCLPLFGLGLLLYLRGKLRGILLMGSLFTYLAYNYLIGVMGNAYNALFPVWTALFSIGVFGLALILNEMPVSSLPGKAGDKFPVRSLSIYVITLGVILALQYSFEIISSLVTSRPPAALQIYTTYELAALELGIMVPLHLIGGILLLRKKAAGYLLSVLLSFTAAMTFISLSAGAAILLSASGNFALQHPSLADIIVPSSLAVIASAFSMVIFFRMGKQTY
jgi:hypothetical protein